MDILKFCSDRICDSPYDVRKKINPLVGSALVSGVSTLLTNEMNRANAQYSFNKQKEYNNWLLGHQTQAEVADARMAGLNPAFMNGSQLGSAPSPPSYDTPEFENPFDLSNLMMLGKVSADTEMSKANAQYLSEQAEGLRIENERKKVEDKEVADYLNESVSFADVDKYLQEHGELPSTVIIGSKGATGRLSAKQRIKQYEAQVQDVSITAVRNEFESMVTNAQISNPKVMAAIDSALMLGLPEARIPLSAVVIEMALSPKSNSAEVAIDAALQIVSATNSGNVPEHIKNGNPNYKYPHDYKNAYIKQQYLPDNVKNAKIYHPKDNKNERMLKEIMDKIDRY